MIINPAGIQRASHELRSRGQVPCFVATAPQNYHDSRCAYGLADDDILQIAGMLVLPADWYTDVDTGASFLMYSVDSELAAVSIF